MTDAEQIVGRERRERVSQLTWCGEGCFDARRRVNSDVMRFYAPDKMTAQERAAKFIIFAIKQAKDAEEFGFTRNECCRNLKTAIHQYWQNKVLKLHGQVHKARMLRSEAALNAPDSECVVEHVMPQMEIVNRLMEMQPLTEQGVIDLLTHYLKVVIITRDEHASLNSSELRSTMPTDWDGRDVFDRYTKMGIKLAATEIRNDRNA